MDLTQLQQLAFQFRPPTYPGSYFLSFEGIEGAGKSTQIIKLKDYLENKGFNVLLLREPGGTSFGEKLRQAILQSSVDIHPLAEAYLFASSRAQLLQEVVFKELAKSKTVVMMDRYIDSSFVYQGHARQLGIEQVMRIHTPSPLCFVPHKTFYLRIPSTLAISRMRQRGLPQDYFESKGPQFLQSLAEGYDLVAQIFDKRIEVIKADENPEQVFNSILLALRGLIP